MPETVPKRRIAVVPLLALAAALWLAGCTSDDPSSVGLSVPAELDLEDPSTSLLTELSVAGTIPLIDEDQSFDEAGALYFGRNDEDESSILVRYDLSSLPDSFPDWTQMSEENIQSVKLRMYQMAYYWPDITDSDFDENDHRRHYLVHELLDTLDVSLYPGDEPAYGVLYADTVALSYEPAILLNVASVIHWAEDGCPGLIIHEGEETEGPLRGYASMDLDEDAYNEIPDLDEGTTLGISLAVAVWETLTTVEGDVATLNELNDIFVFEAIADVSTLHTRPTPSADLSGDIILQTHQRVSPYFAFDLSGLPEDVFVNRAAIRMAVDFERTMGQDQSLVLLEVSPDLLAGADTLDIDTIKDASEEVTGQYSVDYKTIEADTTDWVGWNVTSTVQRVVNGVIDSDVVFLMLAGEDFTSYRVTSDYDPSFYYSRYVFLGTDEDVLKPHLEITYTPFSGGEE